MEIEQVIMKLFHLFFVLTLILMGMLIGWPNSKGLMNVYGLVLFCLGCAMLVVWAKRNL